MKKLNTTSDLKKYLNFGNLTTPFLENGVVFNKVNIDYTTKTKQGKKITILDSLISWIKYNVKLEKNNKEFINANKFQRTAKEIWDSKIATGCTDYAILFCVFARQLGYPCTFLHTAQYEWLQKLKNEEYINVHCGHSFCECYYNNEWILIDPTCREITHKYNPSKLELNYTVGESSIFIPYMRNLDLGKKQTQKEHNDQMDEICKKIL